MKLATLPCLFLGVHRDDGLPSLLKCPDWLVEMRKLRIAVRRRVAFLRFPIGLQALVQGIEPPGDGVVTDVVSLLPEGVGKMTGTLAHPQQRRLRVPTGGRLQQGLVAYPTAADNSNHPKIR
jgi:hypothetical protein